MLWETNDFFLNDRLMVLMTYSKPGINAVPKKKSSCVCLNYHFMT